MATTQEITLEQLTALDTKLLMAALEKQLASAGLMKKRGGKKKAVKPSSADDASSETGRSVGEGTKAWNIQTSACAALVKTVLDGEKGGAGFHLKVLSWLKNEQGLESGAEPTLEQVREAVSFLKEHPEWTSPNQKGKAKKAAESSSDSEEESSAGAAAPSAAAEKPSAKPKGRPKMTEAEKAAKEEEKKAKAAAEKAAKKAAKEAEKKAKAAEKPTKKAAEKAAKKPEPEAEEDEEEQEKELSKIEIEGEVFYLDDENGIVYDTSLERIGTYDGISLTRD